MTAKNLQLMQKVQTWNFYCKLKISTKKKQNAMMSLQYIKHMELKPPEPRFLEKFIMFLDYMVFM